MARFNRFDIKTQTDGIELSRNEAGAPAGVCVAADDMKTQVYRLARDLALLSASLGDVVQDPHLHQDNSTRNPAHATTDAARVRQMISARRRRMRFFPSDIFADPAWDILLDLYLAEIEQRRVMISNLCVAADVPSTTALRWITALIARGMLTRRPDKLDRRRVYVELAQPTLDGMRSYFQSDALTN